MTIWYENRPWQERVWPKADLVLFDPIYDDPDLSYLDLTKNLRAGGSLYAFSDASSVAKLKLALDENSTLVFQNWIIWGPNDWGGRSKTRWGQKHDDILFYTKKGAPHTFNAEAVSVPKKMTQRIFNPSGRTKKIPNSVWDDLAGFSTTAKERVKLDGHAVPWQKPTKLIERIVKASSPLGGLVLDPFGGVATVPLVCQSLGRSCISTEIDPRVYRVGLDRLETFKKSLDR